MGANKEDIFNLIKEIEFEYSQYYIDLTPRKGGSSVSIQDGYSEAINDARQDIYDCLKELLEKRRRHE